MCFQCFCGFPHRCFLTSMHLLLDRPAPAAATLLSAAEQARALGSVGHNWLPHGGFGWSPGLREGTLPISGPEGQHPCPCPAPPCAARGPDSYCLGGSLHQHPPLCTVDIVTSISGQQQSLLSTPRWRLEAGGAHRGKQNVFPAGAEARSSPLSLSTTSTGGLIAVTLSRRERGVVLS